MTHVGLTVIVGGDPRAMDRYVPGSAIYPCARCGEGVAVSPEHQPRVGAPGVEVRCEQCAFAELEEDVVVTVTDQTIEDVSRAVGRRVTRAEALALVAAARRARRARS